MSSSFAQHMFIERHGFQLADCTLSTGRNLLWVGYGFKDGHWLTPEEIDELVKALQEVKTAHLARLASSTEGAQ